MRRLLALISLSGIVATSATLVSCKSPTAPYAKSIALLDRTFQREYYLFHDFDFSSGTVIVTYSDGKTEEVDVADQFQVPNFNTFLPGTYDLTVTYEGLSAKLPNVLIKENPVTSAEMVGSPVVAIGGTSAKRTGIVTASTVLQIPLSRQHNLTLEQALSGLATLHIDLKDYQLKVTRESTIERLLPFNKKWLDLATPLDLTSEKMVDINFTAEHGLKGTISLNVYDDGTSEN